jgi:hypothetical protein
MGRQIDGDERTESGLHVGDEEDEPVESAAAAARTRCRGRIGMAGGHRFGVGSETVKRAASVFER